TPTPSSKPPPAPAGRAGIGNWPFQSHSPWNVPISRTADYETSSTACSATFHSSSGEPTYLSAANWSHSVFQAHSSDPWANISYNPAFYNHPGVIATIRIPTNATPSPPPESQGGDARMYILDPTGHYVDEMWKASKNADGSWSVGSYKRNDLFGAGILQGGMRAYGGSALG